MSGCGQRTGFLTLQTCGNPVVAACVRCGKAICGGHVHPDPSGPCCPDCAVIGLDADEASRRGLDSSYHRYSTQHDGGSTFYSYSDYASFDPVQGGGGEMDGGGAGEDWGEGGDAGDSGGDGAEAFQDS